jgi:hypothetical protein
MLVAFAVGVAVFVESTVGVLERAGVVGGVVALSSEAASVTVLIYTNGGPTAIWIGRVAVAVKIETAMFGY